ncbi:leucine-rich repeat and immunoglobulin-like domain-containing nogo receptor-interacting protein 3 [Branchiostoma lanceolatum]|uniref:leucine-rich repeat and immunoglobulin-like domain-containing nogo receptor-interacting protein 3 n=1 Tax=Branchiostoma lanceolatum TaxID=7740 RepID=UPI0034517A08
MVQLLLSCPAQFRRFLFSLVFILCILVAVRSAVEGPACAVVFADADSDASQCLCNRDTNAVDCQARNLTVVPPGFPARMKRLNLQNNLITALSRDQFGSIDSLIHLDLSNNIINDIDDDVFRGLINLKILELGNNNLKIIGNGTFSGLYNLHQLNLESNKISTIHPQALTSLINLRQLNLQANKVSSIQCALVQNLTWLQLLSLKANPIKLIEDQCFYGLTNLQDIQLKRCSLTQINNGTFKYLVQLSTLNLAWNKISQISPFAFRDSVQLTRLHLNNNNISDLPAGIFANLTNLQKLHLHHNPITSLSTDLFTDLHSLEFLLLHNLKLSSLKEETFIGLPPLQYLDLSSNYLQNLQKGFGLVFKPYWHVKLSPNSWRCDCEIQAIYEYSWIANYVVCRSPLKFQDMRLNQIPYANLSCTLPSITEVTPYVFAVINDTVFLRCNSSGFPTPSLSWVLPQGTMITSQPGASLQSEGENGLTLVIDSAQPTDTGMYICNASNAGGKDFLITYLKVFDPDCVVRVDMGNNTSGNDSSETVFDVQANCTSAAVSDGLSGVMAIGYSESTSIIETKLCPDDVPCNNAPYKRSCETGSKSRLYQPQMVTATSLNCNYLITWFIVGIVAGVSLIISCWIGFTMLYRRKVRERIVVQQAIQKWKRKNNQKDSNLKPALGVHGQQTRRKTCRSKNVPTASSEVRLSENGDKPRTAHVAFAEDGNAIGKKLSNHSSLIDTDNTKPGEQSSEALNEKGFVENDTSSTKGLVSAQGKGGTKSQPSSRVQNRRKASTGHQMEGKHLAKVKSQEGQTPRGNGLVNSAPNPTPGRQPSGQTNATTKPSGKPSPTSYTSPSNTTMRPSPSSLTSPSNTTMTMRPSPSSFTSSSNTTMRPSPSSFTSPSNTSMRPPPSSFTSPSNTSMRPSPSSFTSPSNTTMRPSPSSFISPSNTTMRPSPSSFTSSSNTTMRPPSTSYNSPSSFLERIYSGYLGK